MFDLTDWELIFIWGDHLHCYAKGNKRVLIDPISTKVIVEYEFKKGG